MNLSTRTVFVLPLILLLAACGGGARHETSLADIAQAAARQNDRVNVEDLASWIIEERKDFVLVDVRSGDDFARGHIDSAQNIPIAELLGEEALSDLPTDRKVVVYSNGSENGAKAATLLRVAGLNAQLLVGGFNAWHANILNPDITAEELDGESLEVSAQRAFACYFVGDRGEGAARRPQAEFIPPVFDEDEFEDEESLPAAAEESC